MQAWEAVDACAISACSRPRVFSFFALFSCCSPASRTHSPSSSWQVVNLKVAFYKDAYNNMKDNQCPRDKVNGFMNAVVKQTIVVEQKKSNQLMKVVSQAVQNAGLKKQTPLSQGGSREAYSARLTHDWRVTCAFAKDDKTVLVAHVFESDHDENQPDYTCVIGAESKVYTIVCQVPKNTIE